MQLKRAVQSAVSRDSLLYKLLASVYRHRTPHRVTRAVAIRLHKDSRFDASELEMASFCPRQTLDAVVTRFQPKTWLDVGCGTGQAIQYLCAKGIECMGLEGSTAAIEASPVKEMIRCFNLNHSIDLGRRFDIVWSYEVAEHIHPTFVSGFLDTMIKHGNVIVMSAARPGQGGVGHFNEQPPEYWIDKFEQRGFLFSRDVTEYLHGIDEFFSANLMVFECGKAAC